MCHYSPCPQPLAAEEGGPLLDDQIVRPNCLLARVEIRLERMREFRTGEGMECHTMASRHSQNSQTGGLVRMKEVVEAAMVVARIH